jgi:multiple sugar transport system substrate-binding protein
MQRKLTRRDFLRISATSAIGSLIVACGGEAPAQPAAPAAPGTGASNAQSQAPVELRMAWWGSQDRHDRTIKVIELFQKKNPNIKFTYEFSSFDDYFPKMTTQAAGGSLPDIMQHEYSYITDWSSRGLIIPLDEYVKSGVINLSDVSDEFVKGGKLNDKLVGINVGSNTQCWIVDVDLFKKAGVDLPPDNWTWADFEKSALAVHEKLGIWGMGDDLLIDAMWKNVYFSLGQWVFSNDGTQIGYTDDKPFVDHLNMVLRLQKAGAIPPRPEEISSFRGKGLENKAGVTGKSAMDVFSSNQIVAYWKAAGDNRNFKLVPIPRMPGGKSANYIKPSQFLSITANSKHPTEAAMFLDFFTNDLEANEILGGERGVPIAAKVRDALKPKLSKAQLEAFDYVARVGKDAQPIPPPDPSGYTDIVKNVYVPQVTDPVMYEQITPEQGAAVLRKEADTILAKNKK